MIVVIVLYGTTAPTAAQRWTERVRVMAEYFAGGHLRFVEGEWRDDNGDVVYIKELQKGQWETVHGVLTPCGDPLKRCSFCRSRESEHLDGIEHPSNWKFCPICGADMSGVESKADNKVHKSRCHKCAYETTCLLKSDKNGKCPRYKRDAPDGGYYG